MSDAIYIDGQVFQSAAWDRGMGKYSLGLLRSITGAAAYKYKKTYIIFTNHMPLSEGAEKAIKAAAPKAELLFVDLSIPRDFSPDNLQRMERKNRKKLNDLIDSNNDQGADFLILSLFIDQVCVVFPSNTRKILLFYDLIPLQYCERYGTLPTFANYLVRFGTILEADRILTISQTVADDLVVYVGIDPNKIHNIDGAPIERGKVTPVKPTSFKVPDTFLLMPSGDDIRKNNYRAVQGFEEYRKKYTDGNVWLLLTSFFQDVTKNELNSLSDHIIFTGNVSEAELRWLYENSEALLFVPEYEGLGLPILEAIEVNKPVACSNLTVFNEMSTSAFYYANQLDPLSIANAVRDAMAKSEFKKRTREYPRILARYTWEKTAKKALKVLAKEEPPEIAKKKIAIFTPSPGGYSAIGKVVLQMHPTLSRYFDIDYYVEKGRSQNPFSRPNYLPYIASVFDAKEFNAKKYAQYDAVVYHVGNSEYHLETIKNALHLPGHVILHDAQLADVFDLMNRYGYLSKERIDAEKLLNERIMDDKKYSISSLVNAQRSIIVHSDYTRDLIRRAVQFGTKVTKVNLPTGTPEMKHIKLDDSFTIGFAGIIHKAKGIDLVENIARHPALVDAQIRIFGIPLMEEEDLQRLKRLSNVTITKSPTDFEFQSALANLDVLVNYRSEYKGETSLTAIEALRFGVVPIVRDIGWFSELSSDYCVKLERPEEVVETLAMLRKDISELTKKSEAAREDAKNHRSYELYSEVVSKVVAEAGNMTLNDRIAELLVKRAGRGAVEAIIKKTS